VGGRVADASLPWSAEDEGKESEDQDDDDNEAAAARPAAIDAALPIVPEGGFFVHAVRCGLV
jgi:hypothetical protein